MYIEDVISKIEYFWKTVCSSLNFEIIALHENATLSMYTVTEQAIAFQSLGYILDFASLIIAHIIDPGHQLLWFNACRWFRKVH